jgi:hypothetical protein
MDIFTSKTPLRLLQLLNDTSSDSKPFYLVRTILCSHVHECIGLFFTVSPCISIHYISNGPTNALVCNKTLIQMLHTKTLKITPTCFDHQMIIIRELFDPS